MACCGQKRMAVGGGRDGTAARASDWAAPGAAPSAGQAGDVMLRYRGAGAFTTRSPFTGRVYACATTGASVAVDPRDVAMLMQPGLFQRR